MREAIDWLVFTAVVALPAVAGLVAVKLKRLPSGHTRAGLMVFFAGLALPLVFFGFWLLYWMSFFEEVLILVVGTNVAFGLAGWNFIAVLDELRCSRPPQFSVRALRVAVGYHIWSPLASDAARRRFVASHLWFALFALLTGILLLRLNLLVSHEWDTAAVIGAAVCGGLAVLACADIMWQSHRYWGRREISN